MSVDSTMRDAGGTYWQGLVSQESRTGKAETTRPGYRTSSDGIRWSGIKNLTKDDDFWPRVVLFQQDGDTSRVLAASCSGLPDTYEVRRWESKDRQDWSGPHSILDEVGDVNCIYGSYVDRSDVAVILQEGPNTDRGDYYFYSSEDMKDWSGDVFEPVQDASYVDAHSHSITKDAGGDFWVAWQESGEEIYTAGSDDGSSWSIEQKAVDIGNETELAGLYHYPETGFILLFSFGQEGDRYRYRGSDINENRSVEIGYVTSDDGYSWSDPRVLTSRDGADTSPSILRLPDGDWIVKWLNEEEGWIYRTTGSFETAPFGSLDQWERPDTVDKVRESQEETVEDNETVPGGGNGGSEITDASRPEVSVDVSSTSPEPGEQVTVEASATDDTVIEEIRIMSGMNEAEVCSSSPCKTFVGPFEAGREVVIQVTATDGSQKTATTSESIEGREKEEVTRPLAVDLNKYAVRTGEKVTITPQIGGETTAATIVIDGTDHGIHTSYEHEFSSPGEHTIAVTKRDEEHTNYERASTTIKVEEKGFMGKMGSFFSTFLPF